jgi:hypothetical protein
MIDDKLYQKAIKQYEELLNAKNHLKIATAINEDNLKSMEWMEKFIDFIQVNHINKYNEACDYANKSTK